MGSKKIPRSIRAFQKESARFGPTHEGPVIGVNHLGFIAEGIGGTPFQTDLIIPPASIPKGTEVIELVSVAAVLEFTDLKDVSVDVPLAGFQTWAWCDQNAANQWYARIHVEFHSRAMKFKWWIGMNQSFFFFGPQTRKSSVGGLGKPSRLSNKRPG